MSYKIAIDGPASAGKSTIAKLLSKELGFIYIDTGAMYRALALYLIEHNIDYTNEEMIKKNIDDIEIDIEYKNSEQIVKLNGQNVNKKIRLEKVSDAASKSSIFLCVREKLLNLQRKLANEHNCVMDGRDIASNVIPSANLKIFLTASIDCRANRRYKEYIKKGIKTTLIDTKKEIEERDYRDTNRKINPLIKVDDAILIDTTNMDVDEVLDKILELATGGVKNGN